MDFHPEIFERIRERIMTIASYSDEHHQITRPFLSPAMRQVVDEVVAWASTVGLEPHIDLMGNVSARLPSKRPHAKTLLLGSHLDSVRNAGKFDGVLGVVLGLAVLEQIQEWGIELPFNLEVVGFSDEEGLRFQTAYLGSSYYVGKFDPRWLDEKDHDGMTMGEALHAWGSDPDVTLAEMPLRDDLLGYCEVHIEQGPVLQLHGRAVGLVTSICGQSRVAITINGEAGHAGTTPMDLRRDALTAAAAFISEVELLAKQTAGMVATVGELHIEPGASNVIPARAQLSLDLRHAKNNVRVGAVAALKATLEGLCEKRGLEHSWTLKQGSASTHCDPELTEHLRVAAGNFEGTVPELVSGAGHDGVMISEVCPISMLFVQCKDGLSHHPEEFVRSEHTETAFRAMLDFIRRLAHHHA
jgi:allantoate deiminase